MYAAKTDIHGLAIVKFSFKDLTSSNRTVNRQEEFALTKRTDYAEFEIVSNFLNSEVLLKLENHPSSVEATTVFLANSSRSSLIANAALLEMWPLCSQA